MKESRRRERRMQPARLRDIAEFVCRLILFVQEAEEKARREKEQQDMLLRGNPLLAGSSSVGSFAVKRRFELLCASNSIEMQHIGGTTISFSAIKLATSRCQRRFCYCRYVLRGLTENSPRLSSTIRSETISTRSF